MTQAYIGLGSNQGNALENLKKALSMMDSMPDTRITAVSSVYMTEPVGFEDQPWFYNCVAEIETGLQPMKLLEALQEIENKLGRVRTVRWGPRTIDLDILLYDKREINNDVLVVPHPRMKERAFVMVPLAQIAPDALFPDGQTVREAVDLLNDEKKYSCISEEIW